MAPSESRAQNTTRPTITVSLQVPTSTVGHSTTSTTTRRTRFARGNGGGGDGDSGSGSSTVSAQFINRPPLLLRTPPPVYNSLPATPPPSYTPRSVEHELAARAPFVPEVLPPGRHVITPAQPLEQAVQVAHGSAARIEPFVGRQQQQLSQHNDRASASASTSISTRNIATEPRSTQQHHYWQRAHFENIDNGSISNNNNYNNNNNTDSSTGSNSETDFEFTDHELRRRNRLRRANLLKDAYCPDLLNACSLILRQESTSNSSVGSFTDTPPPLPSGSISDSSNAIESDKIRLRRQSGRRGLKLGRASVNNEPGTKSTQDLRVPRERAYTASAIQRAVHIFDIENAFDSRVFGAALAPNTNPPNQRRVEAREMGQNLSLRRPRISLTWILREQQQQPSSPQQQSDQQEKQERQEKPDQPESSQNAKHNEGTGDPEAEQLPNNNNGFVPGEEKRASHAELLVVPTSLETTATTAAVSKKRYRLKQLPCNGEPLNGYATTPTAHMPAALVAAPQKFFSNQNLLEYKEKPRRDLLFVCTPQRLPTKRHDSSEVLALAKKRNEIRKKLAAKMAVFQSSCRTNDGAEAVPPTTGGAMLERDELKSLKGTYSEPSLVAASEGNNRRHRHRKRRERNRVPKFGYEIGNVDEFLSRCSLASPGNIPVVLSTSSTLYQTRPGGYQVEMPLPLGMVVNAVFKNQNWLYVQTPHAEEGYVGYASCLPLGILPPAARSSNSTKPTPCWESNGDIFPRPCGNMTDSEKEIHLRGGTRSDGARTPRGKRCDSISHQHNPDVDAVNGNTLYGEQDVDKLYLRAASQPKLVEKAYAQLKSTKVTTVQATATDEYVTLQQQQTSRLHVQKHLQQQQQMQQLHHQQASNRPYITNGHNGQHLHPPQTTNLVSTAAPQTLQQPIALNDQQSAHIHQAVLSAVARKQPGVRQTLVAINADYSTESISLNKGEIVTLRACRESKDRRQWFYVRTKDGREGYIPAEVAGHGFL